MAPLPYDELTPALAGWRAPDLAVVAGDHEGLAVPRRLADAVDLLPHARVGALALACPAAANGAERSRGGGAPLYDALLCVGAASSALSGELHAMGVWKARGTGSGGGEGRG
eukprot:2084331-Pleurochrysis_carterae.AAC.2